MYPHTSKLPRKDKNCPRAMPDKEDVRSSSKDEKTHLRHPLINCNTKNPTCNMPSVTRAPKKEKLDPTTLLGVVAVALPPHSGKTTGVKPTHTEAPDCTDKFITIGKTAHLTADKPTA